MNEVSGQRSDYTDGVFKVYEPWEPMTPQLSYEARLLRPHTNAPKNTLVGNTLWPM